MIVYDPYKNNLDNIFDSNIDDIMASIINTNLYLSKQIILGTQLGTLFDVLLLSEFFSETKSSGDKNSSQSEKRNISPILLPSIMSKELLNFFSRLFDNYSKLKKRKSRAIFMFWSLKDLYYIIDHFGS